MRPLAKVGLVGAGCIGALSLAVAAVASVFACVAFVWFRDFHSP